MTDFVIVDDVGENRYEIHHEQETAYLEYSRQPWGTTLVHTEVPKDLEGHGYAAALVKHAVEDARARGEKVIPICPFAKTWLSRHHEYDDVVHSAHAPGA